MSSVPAPEIEDEGLFGRIRDRVIDADSKEPGDDLERARLLGAFALVFFVLSLVFVPLNLVMEPRDDLGLVWSTLGASGAAATLLILRVGWFRTARIFFPLQFLVVLTGSTWTQGGLESAAVLVYPLIPFMATLLGGARVGLLVAAVQMSLLAVLLGLEIIGLVSASVYSGTDRSVMVAVAGALSCLFAASTAGLFEQSRARAEAEQRATLNELKRTNQELADARDRAEAASRVKSEFVARVSHEIRTPMHGVLGMNELLLDSELDSEQREYAVAIRRSADALLALIDDVLDFAQIETGQVKLKTEEFNPRRPLEDAVRVLATAAERKGLVLTGIVAPDVPRRLSGDPDRLRQVLVNLVGNAVKYTDEGKVAVRGSWSDGRLRFVVEDTGIGLGPDQAALFEPFTQADTFVTRKSGGIGLGLAICQELVTVLGGEIAAEDRDEGGSRFWFELPADAAANQPQEARDQSPLASKRVFVWCDHPDELEALITLLSAWGASVVAATDPGEARARLGEGPWDAVLLDTRGRELTGEATVAEAVIGADPDGIWPVVLLMPFGQSMELGHFATRHTGRLGKPLLESHLWRAMVQVFHMRPTEQPQTPSSGGNALPGGSILVVDDNEVGRALASKVLQRLGYEVTQASDGAEALQRMDGASFDAILMDCQMPGMTGYEVAAEIRRQEPWPGANRIVAVTAHALGDERERCLAAGMNDYLAKPFLPEQLAEVLARQITLARRERQTP